MPRMHAVETRHGRLGWIGVAALVGGCLTTVAATAGQPRFAPPPDAVVEYGGTPPCAGCTGSGHRHGHHGHGCRHGCGHHCGHGLGDCGHWLHHDTIEKRYFLRSQGKSWHSAWYDPAEGRPIALVVPPTAEFQTQYSWGVPSSRVAPIYHQFRRPYPGPGAIGGGSRLMPTPNQPSDTVQFGVHAIRGPWGAY